MNTSVDPHQQVTSRDNRCVFLKLAMSSVICSASSYLFFAFLTYDPSNLFTYSRSNAAFIGRMPERNVSPFAAFAQADRAHLRQRPYRARFVSADQFDTRHEGGADSAHSG